MEWQKVNDTTWRLAVPGGWLYNKQTAGHPPVLAFVQDPEMYAPLGRLQSDPNPFAYTKTGHG